jgi:uncharacterized membrane protein YhaH (DUF805 family)
MLSALFSFKGRLNRAPFWGFSLLLSLVIALIQSVVFFAVAGPVMDEFSKRLSGGTTPSLSDLMAIFPTAGPQLLWLSLALQILFIIPAAALCVKRRHDRNSSGIDIWIFFGLSLAVGTLPGLLGIGYRTVEVQGIAFPTPEPWLQAAQVVMAIFSIYLFIVLAFLKGTIGPNNYGPDLLQG